VSDTSQAAVALLVATSIPFLCGICFFPATRLSHRPRAVVLFVMECVVLSSPRLPMPYLWMRFVVSLMAIMVSLKLYDLNKTAGLGVRFTFWRYLLYLPNGFMMVWRRGLTEPRKTGRQNLFQLAIGLVAAGLCVPLLTLVFRMDWASHSVIVEHCAKVLAIFLTVQFVPNIGAAGRRLVGIPATDFVHGSLFSSRSPAEFWRRYNRPAGQFLHEYVFKPAGGLRNPTWAAFSTFAVNGLVHEYVFDVAADRLLGWPTAFFLIQGAAVAATFRFDARGVSSFIGAAATLVFNLATSALFFVGLNSVVPFYASR
jgi:MBOAT, membrane-bound O-acyltransferase family